MKSTRNVRWATQEFGSARLGDERRSQRLVRMAACAAASPAGKVTEVFSDGAEREGAFRLLENDAVAVEEIARAAHAAAARRCFGASHAWIPVDASSLKLTDPEHRKGLGVVGTWKTGAAGLCVMSAIAVTPDGAPCGLVGQRFWARTERAKAKKHDRRSTDEKETRHFLDVLEQARAVFAAESPSVSPWYQIDRAGDAWPIIEWALDTESLLTVRAARDRRLMGTVDDDKREYLWPTLEQRTTRAVYKLVVPTGPDRSARTARMELQFCRVVLDLVDNQTSRHRYAPVWAVRTHEVGTTPVGEEPIEWLLLTTRDVSDVETAELVIQGYAARWRIEEFHKAWKSVCRVEDTLLEERDHIERWATILASVAMRIVRLTYLGRTTPDAAATVELTRSEIDAIILLKKPRGLRRGATPTIADATRWLAELGGYTGKSSGGPPGAIVIARGLRRIESVAAVLDGGEDL